MFNKTTNNHISNDGIDILFNNVNIVVSDTLDNDIENIDNNFCDNYLGEDAFVYKLYSTQLDVSLHIGTVTIQLIFCYCSFLQKR